MEEEEEEGGTSLADLRDVRAALARAQGRAKLDLILDAPDPAALVRSLPAEDLYFAVMEIGTADAGPLVQLSSPEQFRTFVDLDAWQGNELSPSRLATWLDLARSEDDEENVRKRDGLDREVLELLIRSAVQLIDLEEEEDPGDVAGNVEKSPDGRFLLVYPEGPLEFSQARQLVFDLYDQDAYAAVRLLSAVRWELQSELTETALRWRNARLSDLGFPTPEEAASLYARVPRAAAEPASAPAEPAGFFLAHFERGSLLDRALARLPEDAQERLGRELVAVLNMALVADDVDVTDLGAVRETALAVRETIALGLAASAASDDAAAEVLAGAALKRLFQVGFTRTLELRWRLDRLLASLPLRLVGATAVLGEAPDDAIAAGLLERRPRFGGDGAFRPFADPADVDASAAALDRLQQLGAVLAEAGLDPRLAGAEVVAVLGSAGLASVRASDLLATAVAREAAGLGRSFGPLPAASIPAAVAGLFEGSVLRGSIRERAGAWLPAPLAAVVLDRLEREALPQLRGETDAFLPILVKH